MSRKEEQVGNSESTSKGSPGYVDRRSFLRTSLGATAGGLLAYSTPIVSVMGRSQTGDISPANDCALQEELSGVMATFSFSPEAQSNLETLWPVSQKFRQNEALTDAELDQVWEYGWLLAAEVNDVESTRELMNRVVDLPAGPWPAEPDNQDNYIQPDYEVNRARLLDFPLCECACVSFIVSIILIVVSVALTPSAY